MMTQKEGGGGSSSNNNNVNACETCASWVEMLNPGATIYPVVDHLKCDLCSSYMRDYGEDACQVIASIERRLKEEKEEEGEGEAAVAA